MPLQIPNPPVASAVADIEAPLLDLDPNVITSMADNEVVTTIDCGNGFSAYYSSNTADRVKWRTAANGHNGRAILRFAQQGHIRVDDVFASPRNRNVSIYWAFRITTAGAQPLLSFHAGGNTNTSLWMRLGTLEPPGWSLDSRLFHAAAQSRPDGWHSGFLASDHDSTAYPIPRGDVSYDMQAYRASNGGVTASNMTAGNGLQLGAASNGMGMDLARLIVFPRKLPWSKHVEVSRYLAATYATFDHTSRDGIVICLGNSTTAEGPPYYLAHELAADLGWPVYNTGISSGTVATMTNQHAEIFELINTYRAMGKKVVLVAHHGHNNNYDNATIAHLKSSQFAAYRAAGAYMILCAPTPWHAQSTREANRLRLLQWARGEIRPSDSDRPQWVSNYADALDGPSYYDALVDLDDARVEGDRVLGDWSATVPPPLPSSPPHPEEGYYRDSVHHTVSGYQLIAELQAPAVRAAAGVAPGLITPAVPSRSAGTADSLTIAATAPSGGRAPYTQRVRLNGEDAGVVTSWPRVLTDLDADTEYSVVIRTEDATGYYRDSAPVLMSTEEGDDPGDETPPTVASMVVPAGGGWVDLTLSEPVVGNAGFSVAVNGSPRVSTTSNPSATVIRLAITTVYAGQAVAVSYTPGDVQDAAGNPLAAFTAQAATNNSTQEPEGPGPDPDPLSLALAQVGGTSSSVTLMPTVANAIGSVSYAWRTLDGDLIATGSPAIIADLEPLTSYQFVCEAVDSASPPRVATATITATTTGAIDPGELIYQYPPDAISRVMLAKPVGVKVLRVEYGERFGEPTPLAPIKVTVSRRTTVDPLLPWRQIAVWRVIGRVENTLILDEPIEGTTDVRIERNDAAAVVFTGGDMAFLRDAIRALSGQGGEV